VHSTSFGLESLDAAHRSEGPSKLDKRGDTVARTKIATGEDTLEYRVAGRTVTIVTRPADDDGLARLFEIDSAARWSDSSPLTDEDVAAVVRGLIDKASRHGQPLEVIGVSPAAALAFPGDSRVSISPVEPFSFSLPGSPTGLVLQMDARGDAHISALGEARVPLGSDGMWWVLNRLIEAMTEPATVARWPRFITLGGTLGGPATQATLELGDWGIGIVWARLQSGVVGEIMAMQELSFERARGWLSMLLPVRDDLERRRVHRQRLRPARTAEKWARVLERWND
jgi:hypothetical protein